MPGMAGTTPERLGPPGLMEKDLCLDVALRLGKIIQQRLPGADVVYTRSDDTFIPLEERTHIANEAKADLFISIHANSSHDHGARGIETYYLNLKGSPDAMEVASRENATAQESVHDLEDLVKKIARSEKIDESREFAADIQDSLAKRIQKTVQAGEGSRSAQGAVCGADWRGYAVDPDGDFVPEQSCRRAAIEEAGSPPARCRRFIPRCGELPAELEQHDREPAETTAHARPR